jgi:TPR repeat protein
MCGLWFRVSVRAVSRCRHAAHRPRMAVTVFPMAIGAVLALCVGRSSAASPPTLAELLARAQHAEQMHRGKDPGADAVLSLYRQVLARDQNNQEARQALARITVRYAELIEGAEALEEFGTARTLIERVQEHLADTAWRVEYMAREGDARAQAAMGLMLRQGLLVPKSWAASCDYYKKAMQQGNIDATYRYALCIAPTDRGRGLDLLRKAAAGGHAGAQHLLGEAYLNSREGKSEQAFRLVKEAADQGRRGAQTLLGWMYASGTGTRQDRREALRLYKLAAEAGDPSACNNLGEFYETAGGSSHDDARAAYWYRKAAESGVPAAQFNLGRLYAEGRGVPRNFDQARSWLQKAREGGVAEAEGMLRWLGTQQRSPR